MVGYLAEQCLAAWGCTADVVIVGASSLNHRDWSFASDSELESAVKRRLLACSRVRCVASHSQKLIDPAKTSGWPFAALANFDVDMVLTDAGISIPAGDPVLDEARTSFLRQASERGVFVAVAPRS